MNYLQFDFEIDNQEQLEKLVALLADQGFDGFEEEEDHLDAFIAEHQFNEAGFAGVLDRFEKIIYVKTVIENINWNKKWEEDFNPVVIADFVAIRAGFHQPVTGVQHEIIITPKMSFGTGHHATTYLMLQEMRKLNFTGKTVFDFGTGTGILAILASKLGAAKVWAIDYDEWSINNTRENMLLNQCEGIHLEQDDSISSTESFDILLANINLNVIVACIDAMTAITKPGAILLLSGFLQENEKDILAATSNAGLLHQHTEQRGDWIMVAVKKQP